MIQELLNHKFNNHYNPQKPNGDDYLIVYHQGKILAKLDNEITYPKVKDYNDEDLIYLFDFDDKKVFLLIDNIKLNGYEYYLPKELRESHDNEDLFLGITALHLATFYIKNKYCGCCGALLNHKKDERALICPNCDNIIYPTISPVVIIGIISNDHKKILLTKYNKAHSSYSRYALNAGFVEIGEDLESAIRREIKEEVGLDVTNIKYYKSQPWGFSSSLIVGFTCNADDNVPLKVEEDELSDAVWLSKDEIPASLDHNVSLTWSIIEDFRNNKI